MLRTNLGLTPLDLLISKQQLFEEEEQRESVEEKQEESSKGILEVEGDEGHAIRTRRNIIDLQVLVKSECVPRFLSTLLSLSISVNL